MLRGMQLIVRQDGDDGGVGFDGFHTPRHELKVFDHIGTWIVAYQFGIAFVLKDRPKCCWCTVCGTNWIES